jgi:hypothetical protein
MPRTFTPCKTSDGAITPSLISFTFRDKLPIFNVLGAPRPLGIPILSLSHGRGAIVVQAPFELPLELVRHPALAASRFAELRYDCSSQKGLATITRNCRPQRVVRKRKEWLDLPVSISSILIRS